MNQTALISLQFILFSNNVGTEAPETKPTDRATSLLAQPADNPQSFLKLPAPEHRSDPVRPAVVRLSAAGEGGSKVIPQQPQALFSPFCKNPPTFSKIQQYQHPNQTTFANKNKKHYKHGE
jgi:hypothetical protein